MSADGLTPDKAVLDTKEDAASVSFDVKLQRAIIKFARPVANGRHTLRIDYHGVIGVGTGGFFATDYDSPTGKRRSIATDFEPAFERRLMPLG
jgi:aminopeptidase N